jgi:hypothetical protein
MVVHEKKRSGNFERKNSKTISKTPLSLLSAVKY